MNNEINTKDKTSNFKISFLIVFGPFVLSVVLLFVLLRYASMVLEVNLLAITIIGLGSSYYWRWKGLCFTFAILVLYLAYNFTSQSPIDWVWIGTLFATITSMFVVAGISFDEFRDRWKALVKENEDQKQALAMVYEHLQSSQNKFRAERDETTLRVEQLEKDLFSKQEKLSAANQLVNLAREELLILHENREKLLQELYDVQSSKADFNQNAKTISSASSDNVSGNFPRLFEEQEYEIQRLKMELDNSILLQQQNEAKINNYILEIGALTREVSALKQNDEVRMQKQVVRGLNEQVEILTREKRLLESSLSRFQHEFDTLNSHYQQKDKQMALDLDNANQDINKFRQELVKEREKSLILQQNAEKSAMEFKEIEEQLIEKLTLASQQLVELEQKVIELKTVKENFSVLSSQLEKESILKFNLQQQLESLISEKKNLVTEIQILPSPSSENIQKDSRELRRIEGLYLQLREQFAEKSAILDATRRELFIEKEKFLALQKDFEDRFLDLEFDQANYYKDLLSSAEKELDQTRKDAEIEIDNLKSIITEIIPNLPILANR